MRASLSLLISAILFASAAAAQPAADATTAPAKATSPGPKVVDGLTVTGKAAPLKQCSERDEACIAMVVAELKQRYPEQLKKFCFLRQMQTLKLNLQGEDFFTDASGAPAGGTFYVKGALKTACRSDKK